MDCGGGAPFVILCSSACINQHVHLAVRPVCHPRPATLVTGAGQPCRLLGLVLSTPGRFACRLADLLAIL